MRTVIAIAALAVSAALTACGTTTGNGAGTGAAPATSAPGLAPAGVAPQDVVMLIRHAEKPDGELPGVDADGNEDDSSLTEVGWQRANRLVDLFDPAQGAPRAGLARPTAIYAAGVTDDGEGQRTRETVAPLADRLGLPVDTEYGRTDPARPRRRPGGHTDGPAHRHRGVQRHR
jgi:hypothetical protein